MPVLAVPHTSSVVVQTRACVAVHHTLRVGVQCYLSIQKHFLEHACFKSDSFTPNFVNIKKSKVFYGQEPPIVENLLPLFVGAIINDLQKCH